MATFLLHSRYGDIQSLAYKSGMLLAQKRVLVSETAVEISRHWTKGSTIIMTPETELLDPKQTLEGMVVEFIPGEVLKERGILRLLNERPRRPINFLSGEPCDVIVFPTPPATD